MRARADDSPAGAVTSRERGTTWVVSRHLLVAQAVSAALTSIGVEVHAIDWAAAVCHVGRRDREADTDEDIVVILDDMETPGSITEINHLATGWNVRVVVVTQHSPDIWWGGLLESDAVEVVSLVVSVQQLADTLLRFVAGETLMEPHQREVLRMQWIEAVEKRRRLRELMATLSRREAHVLELLASGYRVTEIGQMLELSSATIRSHVKSLRRKLGAQTQLVAVAMLIQLREQGMTRPLVPRPRTGDG